MKKTTLTLIVTMCFNFMTSQEKFKVYYTDESKTNTNNFDKFIFAHNFFADAFYRTDLYKQLSSTDMAEIIETIRQKITPENAIKFEFPQNDKTIGQLIFHIEKETKDGPVLIMSTNFDQNNRKFNKKEDNHLVRWYFIKNNLIVYRKNLFNNEDEEKFIKEKENGELVELYLFDEILNNNTKVEKLINEIFSDKDSTEIQKLYAYLYQQEYYLSINRLDLAEKSNTELNEFYNKNEGKGITKNYLLVKNMANSEFEIMKLIN